MKKFTLTVPFNRTLRKSAGWQGVSKTEFRTMRLHLHCVFHTTDESSRLGEPIEYSVQVGDEKFGASKSAALLPDLDSKKCFRHVLWSDPSLNKFVDDLWKELGHGPATQLSSSTRIKLTEDLRRSFTHSPHSPKKPALWKRKIEFVRKGPRIDTSINQDLIAVPRYRSQGWDLYLYLIDFLTLEYTGSKPSAKLKRFPPTEPGGPKWWRSRDNVIQYNPPFPLADLQDWDYDPSGGRILLPGQGVTGHNEPDALNIAEPRDRKHPGHPFKLDEEEESLYKLAHRAFPPSFGKFESMTT
jgi:hypothetical protein